MPILTTLNDSVSAGLSWKEQFKSAIRDPFQLAKRLGIAQPTPSQVAACESFGLFAPEPFLSRIDASDPNDPLLRQILPLAEENESPAGFTTDPLAEDQATRTEGLLQKYQGRVLLITNSVCAINCRYCFRRHFPYEQTPHSQSQWETAIAEIANDPTIEEVIFSGGDPLTLVDERLIPLVQAVDAIPHVERIRFHTRLPIVIPDRITAEFCEALSNLRAKSIMVVHCNHANELDAPVAASLKKLANVNCQLLNQSVLLRGVNDSTTALVELSKRLMDCGVLPYYLHQLDRVQGAAHFEVPEASGKKWVTEMRAQLPGYLVPRYAKEEPGQPNKTILL